MKNLVFPLILIVILLGGGYFLLTRNSQKPSPQPTSEVNQPASTNSEQTVSDYQSKVLAGTSSPFLEFNTADYEKALAENKIILLDFYANWCPICRGEAPYLHQGFDGLTSDRVIGFRVNFNDSDTDEDEKTLAKQFSIPYQHTKVIIKEGKEVSRSLDSWTKEKFNEEISRVL